MNIVGFSNPNNYYPSPLIAFASQGDRYFAIYPSCKIIEIDGFANVASEIPNYWSVDNMEEILEGSYAFGLSGSDVIIGKPSMVREKIEFVLKESNSPKHYNRLLQDFLMMTREDSQAIDIKNGNSWINYLEKFNNKEKIRCIVTDRAIIFNGQAQSAKRIIVQHLTSSGFKSHFRKNLHHNEDLNSPISRYPTTMPKQFFI